MNTFEHWPDVLRKCSAKKGLQGLASHCKAFTFHFSILTMSNAFLKALMIEKWKVKVVLVLQWLASPLIGCNVQCWTAPYRGFIIALPWMIDVTFVNWLPHQKSLFSWHHTNDGTKTRRFPKVTLNFRWFDWMPTKLITK